MAGLLIRDIPPELHERLKASASKNHRSMSKEALAILEEAFVGKAPRKVKIPRVHKGKFPITQEFIDKAIIEGRP